MHLILICSIPLAFMSLLNHSMGFLHPFFLQSLVFIFLLTYDKYLRVSCGIFCCGYSGSRHKLKELKPNNQCSRLLLSLIDWVLRLILTYVHLAISYMVGFFQHFNQIYSPDFMIMTCQCLGSQRCLHFAQLLLSFVDYEDSQEFL